MYKINVELEGLVPILFNRFVETQPPPKATEKDLVAHAMTVFHTNIQGEICLPGEAIILGLARTCTLMKIKENGKNLGLFIKATVFIPDEPCFGVKAPDAIHKSYVKNARGQMFPIYRPMLNPGWVCSYTMQVLDDRRDEHNLKLATQEMGVLNGLGSWRPKYGRFEIKAWEVSK